MEKQTISVQELAKQLGISVPKAYELTKTPGFPSIWLKENSSNKEGVK